MSKQTDQFVTQALAQVTFIEDELEHIIAEGWKEKKPFTHSLDTTLQRVATSARELVALATVLRVELELAPKERTEVPQTASNSGPSSSPSQTASELCLSMTFGEYIQLNEVLSPSRLQTLLHLVQDESRPSSPSRLEALRAAVQNIPQHSAVSPGPQKVG